MNPEDIKKIATMVSTNMEDYVRTTVYEHQIEKGKEVSALHREIKDQLKELSRVLTEVKAKVDTHDLVVQELMNMYRTGGTVRKFFISIIIGIPSLAAFAGSIIYLYNLFKTNI